MLLALLALFAPRPSAGGYTWSSQTAACARMSGDDSNIWADSTHGFRWNFDLHVQFPGTHNVDGDSASITMATAIISAFEGVPIDQNLAMTGSLTVRGEVLPIGGVSAKIEAAVKSGIKRVVIPRSNMNDVLIDEKFESQVEILAVDSLDEVLEHALVGKEEKVSLVERLAKVIDTISSGTDKQPSA